MKLLILKPSSLGDIIHGLMVVESLRQAIPTVEVTWVVREIFESFVSACYSVDKTICFERNKGLKAFIPLRRLLQQETYDVVLDMQGLLRSGLMAFFARSPRKIGRFDAREGASFFCNEQTCPLSSSSKMHAVEVLLSFLPLFGLPAQLRGKLRFKNPSSANLLSRVRAESILLFPNSRRQEKEWWGFEALSLALLQKGLEKQLVWAGDQATDVPEALHRFENFLDLRGHLPLEALPSLVEHSSLVIANDSGPMHLAAAMGKSLLALFGPTDPALYGPYPLDNPKHHILRSPSSDLKDLELSTVLSHCETILAKIKR